MEQKIQNLASLGTRNFTVYLDEVSLRDGAITKRICIDHPQAAAIVPLVSEDEVIMVRQYRYALRRETLEIPAGKMDKGESPEETIKRELVEETGFEARVIKWLYTYAPAVGYSNELIHVYVGRDLRKLDRQVNDKEISSLEVFTLGEALGMIRNHEIVDSKTIIALAFLRPLI